MSAALSSGDVERVLIHMALVTPAAEVAFRARLKHLQRLGIPLGANTGKGRRVPHSLDTLFQLVIGLELMQVGIPPATVARTLKWNWAPIREGLLLVAAPVDMVRANRTRWPNRALFLVQSPHALESLMDTETPGSEPWYDDVQIVHADDLLETITKGDPEALGPGRAIVLDLCWLSREALGFLKAVNPAYSATDGWKAWRDVIEEHAEREIELTDDEGRSNVDPET